MNLFAMYDLFYYEAGNKLTTRCVETFKSASELDARLEQLRAIPDKCFIFPDYTESENPSPLPL